jgi:predicted transcriptional regulator
MKNDWILDVLADLKTFAEENELSDLARHLVLTKEIARKDIAKQDSNQLEIPHTDAQAVGNFYSPSGADRYS